MKLKVNDTIKVTLGKDRGKTGKIEKIFPKKNMVQVPGINVYKKHLKAQGESKPGGIIDLVKPMYVSKVALICPKCQKITRVGYQGQGKKKVRICKKCKAIL
ncbi:MAG: 50S ribosomal protein L24 [Candidatus Beckwithbacteria bacterium]|nr:50S ribosomal protein L24 [Patescibacteria group bacterium]